MQNEGAPPPPESESARPGPGVWGGWPTVGFGLVIGVALLVIQVLVVLVFVAAKAFSGPPSGLLEFTRNLESNGLVVAFATVFSAIAGSVLIAVFVKARKNATIAGYLGLRRISRKTVFAVLGLALALMAISEGVDLFVKDSPNEQFMIDAYRTSRWPALLWVALVVFAPIFEEAFFRGFLFVGLRQSGVGAAGAIGLTALGWAALHGQYDWYGMATILVLGVALGIVRLKTGSLLPPLIVHSLWNFTGTLLTALYVKGVIS